MDIPFKKHQLGSQLHLATDLNCSNIQTGNVHQAYIICIVSGQLRSPH